MRQITNKMKVIINLFFCVGLSNSWLIIRSTNNSDQFDYKGYRGSFSGDPLILTPYLQTNDLNLARSKAEVTPIAGKIVSYSGFFTVDPEFNSNMFFWYFPAEELPDNAPVVVWLQGGPGGSSLYGLFMENGPYTVIDGVFVQMRKTYWSQTMHMVYIDNPVATGFSFTDNKEGYSTNDSIIADHLFNTLLQFFILFPELIDNDLYLAGESYAGKYVPALGYRIHQVKVNAQVKMNLKGIILVDGMVDPYNQLEYGDFLSGIGLIDENQRAEFTFVENRTKQAIRDKDWDSAFAGFAALIGVSESLYQKYTGFTNIYNYLISEHDPEFTSDVDTFLDYRWVRNALHVGNLKFRSLSQTGDVYRALVQDFMQSVAPKFSTIANNYRVLLINGQMDVIISHSSLMKYLKRMKWCGSNDLHLADRKQFDVNYELAGYTKISAPQNCRGSLILAMIRNAGHMVPRDQPDWTYELVKKFVFGDSTDF